jgi:hypothetical protein
MNRIDIRRIRTQIPSGRMIPGIVLFLSHEALWQVLGRSRALPILWKPKMHPDVNPILNTPRNHALVGNLHVFVTV